MQKLGHPYQRVSETEDAPKVPRDAFFSRISRLEAEYLPDPALATVGALTLIRQTDRRNGSDRDLKYYFPGPILGLSRSRWRPL
jgi:hypothetical protein